MLYEEFKMRTVELEHLRPDEVLEELKRCPIAYLPAGPVEWHNPANPLGVDAFIAKKTAVEAAKKTGGVVFPTLFIFFSELSASPIRPLLPALRGRGCFLQGTPPEREVPASHSSPSGPPLRPPQPGRSSAALREEVRPGPPPQPCW